MDLLPELSVPKPSVLIVDDDPMILKALDRLLKTRFEVVTAESAAAARVASEGRQFELVLSDYSMPGENGLSLIRSLRARGHHATAALVTAVAETDEIRSALRTGELQRMISKPWSPFALLREALALARL